MPFSHTRRTPALLDALKKVFILQFRRFHILALPPLSLSFSGRILFAMSCIIIVHACVLACVLGGNAVTSAWAKRATEPHKVDAHLASPRINKQQRMTAYARLPFPDEPISTLLVVDPVKDSFLPSVGDFTLSLPTLGCTPHEWSWTARGDLRRRLLNPSRINRMTIVTDLSMVMALRFCPKRRKVAASHGRKRDISSHARCKKLLIRERDFITSSKRFWEVESQLCMTVEFRGFFLNS